MSHNKKHSGSVTRPLMKHTALLLAGLITTAFSTAHSPTASDLQIFHIFITSPKSLIVHSILLQKSFKYARNKSGPKTLPWCTPDVTLTSSHNCPFNRLGPQRCWSPLHIFNFISTLSSLCITYNFVKFLIVVVTRTIIFPTSLFPMYNSFMFLQTCSLFSYSSALGKISTLINEQSISQP
jgi:hypothetical protein